MIKRGIVSLHNYSMLYLDGQLYKNFIAGTSFAYIGAKRISTELVIDSHGYIQNHITALQKRYSRAWAKVQVLPILEQKELALN